MTNKHSKSKDDSWHIIDIHITDTDRLYIDKSIDIQISISSYLDLSRGISIPTIPGISSIYLWWDRSICISMVTPPSQGDLFSISGARLLFGSLALGIALAIVARHGPTDGPWRKDVGHMGDLYGFVWSSMDLYGFVWICMDFYGFEWICMDLYGFIRIYRALWRCNLTLD